ncbi:MAG: uracil-DNA glycosylase [Coriobacteriia bacterium]|nr:uracil-DNA glycosylase [Coriobacteriia bacterium]
MKVEKLSLEQIRAQVTDCRRCELCEGRTNVVFGEGDPHARVLIIGEAPGKNEDLKGRPFVGAAGKFLDELLAHAGLAREEVFIANVLKCRPPSNRNPRSDEIEACAPYLRMQTRSINPDIIVTMGNFATQFILRTGVGITRLRGTWQTAGKFVVFPIFHPAAAIYDRSKRDVLFSDFDRIGQYVRDRIAAEQQSKQIAENGEAPATAAAFASDPE